LRFGVGVLGGERVRLIHGLALLCRRLHTRPASMIAFSTGALRFNF
jgi:hypothetical protein